MGRTRSGIDLDRAARPGELDQRVEQLADRAPDAARHVVGVGGHAAVEQALIGVDHVVDVEEVAHRGEVADREARLAAARRDRGDLARERWRDEGGRLAGPGVVEGSHAHHVEAALGVARAEQVGARLRARVGRARREGIVLAKRRAHRPRCCRTPRPTSRAARAPRARGAAPLRAPRAYPSSSRARRARAHGARGRGSSSRPGARSRRRARPRDCARHAARR